MCIAMEKFKKEILDDLKFKERIIPIISDGEKIGECRYNPEYFKEKEDFKGFQIGEIVGSLHHSPFDIKTSFSIRDLLSNNQPRLNDNFEYCPRFTIDKRRIYNIESIDICKKE